MKNIEMIFSEMDKIAKIRRKLIKGYKTVFCQFSRGRIGWDLYKATLDFNRKNRQLSKLVDYYVSDFEMEAFLQRQNIKV
jgi:hypothetical protein